MSGDTVCHTWRGGAGRGVAVGRSACHTTTPYRGVGVWRGGSQANHAGVATELCAGAIVPSKTAENGCFAESES